MQDVVKIENRTSCIFLCSFHFLLYIGWTGETDLDKVRGYIDNFIFQNQENGYCVLTLNTEDGELTCVGILHGVSEGMNVEFSGSYTEHPAYGRQFKVESYEEKEPEDEFGMERYLGSGAIKGVGAALAARIVRKFKRHVSCDRRGAGAFGGNQRDQ